MGTPRGKVTAIVAAMPEEVAPLRPRLRDVRRLPGAGPTDLALGWWEDVPLVLVVTGDGARQAREGMAALFANVEVERLVAVGVAGALSADLTEGSLVVAEQVTQEGAPARTFCADDAWVASAATATRAKRALVMTAGRIADTAAEKERLHRLVASSVASSTAVTSAVVDLESAEYVAAALAKGIPWLVLRAVSDTADEALPALLNRCRDEGGAVSRGRVVSGLLGDPRVLPVLLGLRRRVQRCAKILSAATATLLASHSRGREKPGLGSLEGL